jgi:hypothetical protein
VEKIIFLDRSGSRVGELDILEFVRSQEVQVRKFEERELPSRDFYWVTVVASGKSYPAEKLR